MPKLWVNQAGTWKTVNQLWVNDGGTWRSPLTGSIVDPSGIGKQFYPDSAGETTYSIAGTYSYTVPSGVTSLQITYPTITGMVTQTLSVTPAQVIPVVCGDYGIASSFGATSIPAYSKIVFNHSSGNIDSHLYQIFSVATTTVASASTSGTTQGGSSANLNVNGIYFATYAESNQGDFPEDIQISTVPISTLVGNFAAFGQITSSRGESSVTIFQQPAANNSYQCYFGVTENGYSNYPVGFRILAQQQGYIKVTPLNANVISYSNVGTYSFTVPAGVTSIRVTGCGGGGGGGGADAGSNYGGDGGGGGGSNLITSNLSVTPNQLLSITVGAAGTGGVGAYSTGGTGQASTVTGTGVSFSAEGGNGGTGGGNSGVGFCGIGANGANYTSSYRVAAGGTSTNGGSNGGRGGSGFGASGISGQAGKLTIAYGYLS